jgi:hypothetical protein
VGDQTGTFVDLEFENVVMHIERLSFVLQSMSFHLRADGSEVAAIQVPTPPLSFSLASDHGANPDDRGFIPLADASGTTRDLDSKTLSIHVGIPLPNIPGILLMVIPSISGIVYGRRREEGSKGLGVALLAIVVLGAGVYLGLDYLNQPSTTVLVSSFMTSLIPPFDVGGDVIDMLVSYLPWMLAGLAVGGATKNLKTGAILGFGGPMTLFVLNGLMQGDLQLLTSIPDAVPAIVAGFVATGFGILGAVLVQANDSQTTTSVATQHVKTPPSPTSQSEETYTPPIPLSEEELDDSKAQRADLQRRRATWSKTYFYPSKTVLNGIILISILITLFQFGSEAVFYGTALGTFLSSFIVGPLDPSAFATLSFGLLGQAIAIIGMVLLTAVSTRGILGEKQKLSDDMSISGDVIGVGLFGGLITFILMAKYILIALIIIGVLFMVSSFGGMFSSWGASPEQTIMIGAIGAIPFIIVTFSLLLVFTLIATTISNTIAGIYCYVGFNRTRKKS